MKPTMRLPERPSWPGAAPMPTRSRPSPDDVTSYWPVPPVMWPLIPGQFGSQALWIEPCSDEPAPNTFVPAARAGLARAPAARALAPTTRPPLRRVLFQLDIVPTPFPQEGGSMFL